MIQLGTLMNMLAGREARPYETLQKDLEREITEEQETEYGSKPKGKKKKKKAFTRTGGGARGPVGALLTSPNIQNTFMSAQSQTAPQAPTPFDVLAYSQWARADDQRRAAEYQQLLQDYLVMMQGMGVR